MFDPSLLPCAVAWKIPAQRLAVPGGYISSLLVCVGCCTVGPVAMHPPAPSGHTPQRRFGNVLQTASPQHMAVAVDSGVMVGTVAEGVAGVQPRPAARVPPRLRNKHLIVQSSPIASSPAGSAATASPPLSGPHTNRRLAEFPPDCGTERFKHLSLARVRDPRISVHSCVCFALLHLCCCGGAPASLRAGTPGCGQAPSAEARA